MLSKWWTNHRLNLVLDEIKALSSLTDDGAKKAMQSSIEGYVAGAMGNNAYWSLRMFAVDFAYLLNTLVNVYVTNVFIKGLFYGYGVRVWKYFLWGDPEVDADPMMLTFPLVTKCAFHTYGPSGTVQNHDAMCLLPMNVMNQKESVLEKRTTSSVRKK